MQYNFEIKIFSTNGIDMVLNITQRAGLLLRIVIVNVIDNFLLTITLSGYRLPCWLCFSMVSKAPDFRLSKWGEPALVVAGTTRRIKIWSAALNMLKPVY